MNTPKTDEIIKYCEYQFPATQGHIPLRKMIEEIEIEKNEFKERQEFTSQWWASRFETMSRWVRKNREKLPEEFVNQYFCTIANGTPDIFDKEGIPSYDRIVNMQRHRADALEKENESLKKLLVEIQDWMLDNDYECGCIGARLYEEIEKYTKS